MGRGFRFVCVMPLIAACGGTEIGATRHVDGEPRGGDAAPPSMAPGSDAGIIPTGGESGASLADAGVRTLTCRTLPPDALSSTTSSDLGVAGIHFSADAKTAYGIASWDDQRSLWRAALGPDGAVSTTDLVTDAAAHDSGLAYFPWAVSVREIPGMGKVLGLSGRPGPTYVQSGYLWFARESALQTVLFQAYSYLPGDPAATIGDFALAADGQSYDYLTGSLDAQGNLGTAREYEHGMIAQDPYASAFSSLAIAQLSGLLAVSYRTEIRDPTTDPSPTNPRISDHLDQIDFVGGTTNWTLPLAMRRLAQLRVDSAGNTFVVGVLQDGGALEVRKISGTGVTEWAVAPSSIGAAPSSALGPSVGSIVADVTPDGGIVVGWNLSALPQALSHVALQTFSKDGRSCTTRVESGPATDVAALADGSILVAMDGVAMNGAISRFAP